jgi:molecular chaperone GrpE
MGSDNVAGGTPPGDEASDTANPAHGDAWSLDNLDDVADLDDLDDVGDLDDETIAAIDEAGADVDLQSDTEGRREPTELESVTAERDQFKDIALRLQADFDNYRKRVANQQESEIDRATGKIAESLLPVLDACEAAFAHGADGVEPIWSALMGVLQRHGLEALDLAGKPFDPAHADAVVHEPADDDSAEPVVSEVLRTGYIWKGKTLRPAMVKVRG